MIVCWRSDYCWFGSEQVGVGCGSDPEGTASYLAHIKSVGPGSVTTNITQRAATHHAGKNHGVVYLHGRSCSAVDVRGLLV